MPYVGEIRMFGGNFAPAGWAFCDGATLPISENDVLFQLIGTTYGGDGETTFKLPDLRGRLPIHQGTNVSTYVLGEQGGVESVTLTLQQIPTHSHSFAASTNGGTASAPTSNVPANSPNITLYIEDVPTATMNAADLGSSGGSQPHSNFQPYLCISFIISLFGVFPQPS